MGISGQGFAVFGLFGGKKSGKKASPFTFKLLSLVIMIHPNVAGIFLTAFYFLLFFFFLFSCKEVAVVFFGKDPTGKLCGSQTDNQGHEQEGAFYFFHKRFFCVYLLVP